MKEIDQTDIETGRTDRIGRIILNDLVAHLAGPDMSGLKTKHEWDAETVGLRSLLQEIGKGKTDRDLAELVRKKYHPKVFPNIPWLSDDPASSR